MSPTSVMIICDQLLIRQAWSFLINQQSQFSVVAEASIGPESIEVMAQYKPSIILLYLPTPSLRAIEILRLLKLEKEPPLLIVVTVTAGQYLTRKLLNLGIKGYLTTASTRAEFIVCLNAVRTGVSYLCDEWKDACHKKADHPEKSGYTIYTLSKRELEVLRMAATGKTSREIAHALLIAEKTVDVHRYKILKKLKINNMRAVIKYMINEAIEL